MITQKGEPRGLAGDAGLRGQKSAGADGGHCATGAALAATLHPCPLLTLSNIFGVLLARLLRAGGASR
ncbi:MAG TPA: hypothetical protein PKJ45_08425 [Rubrivivax sp.]|nr:hypothetical protein [Rubrivivax sp.]